MKKGPENKLSTLMTGELRILICLIYKQLTLAELARQTEYTQKFVERCVNNLLLHGLIKQRIGLKMHYACPDDKKAAIIAWFEEHRQDLLPLSKKS